ncbi:ABC transporter permease [Planctomonas sp. JC2975]|uniref:ABC transporter permease n=1 Tax=Planctomonas sp. JC2975 TaxID=2729626 RepID=UPI001473886E|nr:ABC transporter permease [Planctomonas sp. JC2975]NNC13482.1 ABC transporter permease [Planctomonas sp. JC2975]
MRAIVLKEFQELRRDRRTLALLIVMPLLLLIIFGYAANFTVDHLTVAVYGSAAHDVTKLIDGNSKLKDHLNVVVTDAQGTKDDATTELRDDRADVAIYAETSSNTPGPEGSPAFTAEVLIDGSNLFAAQSAKTIFAQVQQQLAQQAAQAQEQAAQAAAQAQAQAAQGESGSGTGTSSSGSSQAPASAQQPPTLTVTTLFNPDLKTSWVMIPAIIGLILTFIGTIITSIGLVREREAGTLEQLAVMPLRAGAVVLGKITPYFLLACFDMALITVLGLLLFGVPFNGNPLIFIVGAALFLFVVLGLGVLISSVSRTTGQAIQLAFMVLLPQILLSGMIFPLSAMAAGVRWIGYLLPLTWFTMISQGVMIRGAGWDSLWFPLVILAIMAVVIFGLAVVRLSRSISPVKQPRQPEQTDAVQQRATEVA